MKERSGSQFFNTTTGISSGPDGFRWIEVRYSLLYHLWNNNHVAQSNVSSTSESWKFMARIIKIRIFREEFSKEFSFLWSRSQNFQTIKQRWNSRLSSNQNTVSNMPKVMRANLLRNNGFLCLLNMAILRRFNNPFTMVTSLSKESLRTSWFVSWIKMKKNDFLCTIAAALDGPYL